MMFTQFGIAELLVSIIALLFSIGLPLAILFALYAIYKRLKSIDEHLREANNDK